MLPRSGSGHCVAYIQIRSSCFLYPGPNLLVQFCWIRYLYLLNFQARFISFDKRYSSKILFSLFCEELKAPTNFFFYIMYTFPIWAIDWIWGRILMTEIHSTVCLREKGTGNVFLLHFN